MNMTERDEIRAGIDRAQAELRLRDAGYRSGHLANTRNREYRPAADRAFRRGYLEGWLAVQAERHQPIDAVIWGPFDSALDAWVCRARAAIAKAELDP